MKMTNIFSHTVVTVAQNMRRVFSFSDLNFSRPTITAVALKDAPFYHQKIYEDDEYLFAYRRYGRAEYAPGFFVYRSEFFTSYNYCCRVKRRAVLSSKNL